MKPKRPPPTTLKEAATWPKPDVLNGESAEKLDDEESGKVDNKRAEKADTEDAAAAEQAKCDGLAASVQHAASMGEVCDPGLIALLLTR